jgi:hypothetical protein
MPTDQRHPLGVTEAPEPRSARQTINDMLDAGLLDELMDRVDTGELTLTGRADSSRRWSRRCSSAACKRS